VLRLGPVNDRELKALYGAAQALVFPSTYEGFGLPPVEAMACGCPVAAARAASLPEVCGDAALYFDPHRIDSIRDAVQRLLDDAALQDDLRQRGLRRAATFRWPAAARALIEALPARVAT
jgi:glycosyltransferase involved in cell wall biosynthesis